VCDGIAGHAVNAGGGIDVIDAVDRWGTTHLKAPPAPKRPHRSGANALQRAQ